MMGHNTILYISDRASSSNSVLDALKETGCEVVSTGSPTEGVALLYLIRTVAAVVLDGQVKEQAGFDLERSLKRLRPSVPVMLLYGDPIDRSPSWTDRCVTRDKLTSTVQHSLTAEPVV